MARDGRRPDYIGFCKAADKVRFATRQIARQYRRKHPDGGPVAAYRCDHCDAWHLGHLPKMIKLGMAGRDELRRVG